jgi:hypothetical protein
MAKIVPCMFQIIVHAWAVRSRCGVVDRFLAAPFLMLGADLDKVDLADHAHRGGVVWADAGSLGAARLMADGELEEKS